jgi:FlaA1/EpsC-like NDP-sugar epimerase
MNSNILVTGAGGYIGSALVKALAALQPGSLVMLDSSEQNLFELRRSVSGHALLGSVEDSALLDEVFARFRPQIVFHAAAHKHVELLEWNPFAAVRNNVLGTYALAQAAIRHGSRSFVLVSTDKAVHPHSVMGVSKRIAELLIVSLSRASCRMNAVRLGNVLGSTGSVLPIFLDQMAQGKPITITHPEASRYFLSLDETIAAILAASSLTTGGNVLLPAFGVPLLVTELAQSLLEPGKQLNVEYIGLRPGEKLTEDLVGPDELLDQTSDGPLTTALQTPKFSLEECEMIVRRLTECVSNRNASGLLETLMSVVPEYQPSRVMMESAGVAAQA